MTRHLSDVIAISNYPPKNNASHYYVSSSEANSSRIFAYPSFQVVPHFLIEPYEPSKANKTMAQVLSNSIIIKVSMPVKMPIDFIVSFSNKFDAVPLFGIADVLRFTHSQTSPSIKQGRLNYA